MHNIHPTMRPFVAPWAPKAPVNPLQASRAEAQRAVEMAEAYDPNVMRALRDQQQQAHLRGELA